MAMVGGVGYPGARRGRPSLEYRVYFGSIYLLCLPIAAARWLVGLALPGRPNPGVHRRALREAQVITPMIFSA